MATLGTPKNPEYIIGMSTVVESSFTSPANTTAYSIGNLIGNSTTAASVVPLTFAVSRAADYSGMLRRARVKTTDTGANNATVRLHVYKNDPSLSSGITNGDHAQWLTTESNYVGSFDITLDKHFSDYEKGVGVPTSGAEINYLPSAGTVNVFGLLEARSTFTPVGNKTWSVTLEALQN